MKNARLHFLLLSVLGAAAVLLGRHLQTGAASGGGGEGPATASTLPPARPGRPVPPSSVPGTAHDLAALRRIASGLSAGDAVESGQMSRLSTPALREMINALGETIWPSGPVPDGFQARLEAIRLAAAELYHRDGDAAHAWAESLSPDNLREAVLRAVILAAARDQSLLAKSWLDRFQAEPGAKKMGEFRDAALRGAMERGNMEDIARLLSEPLSDSGQFPTIDFPEGFDFAGLFGILEKKADPSGPFAHWALRDPDSAWAALKQRHSSGEYASGSLDHLFPILFHATLLRDGTEKGVSSAIARLAELSPEQRGQCLLGFGLERAGISVGAAAALATSLPPADRQPLITSLLRQIQQKGVHEKSFAILAALPREEMLGHLATAYRQGANPSDPFSHPDAATRPSRLPGGMDEATSRYFTDAATRLRLTPQELARISRP